MRSFRTFCVGAVAAALLLAGGVSEAEAAPEFGQCVKVANGTGAFANAGCTKPGGSAKYVWHPAPDFAFQLELASDATMFQVGAASIDCSSGTGFGEYASASNVANVHFANRGCEFEGTLCSSLGEEPGEIRSETLEGTLGVITASASNPAKSKIGLDLFASAHAGQFFAEYLCGSTPNTVTGSLIAPVKTNKMLLSSSLKYTARRGLQKPEAFAGEPRDVLSRSIAGAPAEAVGATLTLTLTSEEPVEIRAGVE